MVFLDDVDDVLIEFMFEGKIDALLHVRHDDERAHRWGEIVMRVALEAHVFCKVFRLHQFADVVEIRADTTERGVGADRFGGGLGQVRDDQTVMVGPRRLDGHSPEQRVIQVRRLKP